MVYFISALMICFFRFGDSQLHYCEVMLKDVQDSRRMNTHLHSDSNLKLSDKVDKLILFLYTI